MVTTRSGTKAAPKKAAAKVTKPPKAAPKTRSKKPAPIRATPKKTKAVSNPPESSGKGTETKDSGAQAPGFRHFMNVTRIWYREQRWDHICHVWDIIRRVDPKNGDHLERLNTREASDDPAALAELWNELADFARMLNTQLKEEDYFREVLRKGGCF